MLHKMLISQVIYALLPFPWARPPFPPNTMLRVFTTRHINLGKTTWKTEWFRPWGSQKMWCLAEISS